MVVGSGEVFVGDYERRSIHVFALDGTLTSAVHGGMCPSLSSPKPIVPPPWAFDSSFQMLYFLIRNALCMRASSKAVCGMCTTAPRQ